jgi:hypothetical protein
LIDLDNPQSLKINERLLVLLQAGIRLFQLLLVGGKLAQVLLLALLVLRLAVLVLRHQALELLDFGLCGLGNRTGARRIAGGR